MRLMECTRMEVGLAPRVLKKGSLGGVSEGFSEEITWMRASRIPESGSLIADVRGARYPERLRLIVPGDAQAIPGDGVWSEGKLYRILSAERWSAHVEWLCEAIE